MHSKIEANVNLGPKEKELAQKIYLGLTDYFCELKTIGKLKKKIAKSSKRGGYFLELLDESMKRAEVFNTIMNLADKKVTAQDKLDKVNALLDPGKKNILVNVWFELALMNYIFECEYFRVIMFQVIKQDSLIADGKTTLAPFVEYLTKLNKKIVPVVDLIDLELRNSVAHGLVWYHNEVTISADANFSKVKKISLYELWKRAKSVNIINQVLLIVISEQFLVTK